jgi:hypothetical protein
VTDSGQDLRSLVQTLTRPRKIDTRDDHGHLIAATRHPAMLTELRDAKASTIGQGGSGKLPHERGTLNAGASELYTSIEKRVRSWAIRSGYRPPSTGWPPLEEVLAHWYARTDGDPNLDPAHFTRVLRGWVGAISDLMDPPYRFPLEHPCPECGAEWTDGDIDLGTDPNRALNVIERIPVDRSVIVCHACGHEWRGEYGARALNDQLTMAHLNGRAHA